MKSTYYVIMYTFHYNHVNYVISMNLDQNNKFDSRILERIGSI